jgi:hypothetical protein
MRLVCPVAMVVAVAVAVARMSNNGIVMMRVAPTAQ